MKTNYRVLNDYQNFTDTVAIYPKHFGLQYCSLGLADESAEMFEKCVAYANSPRKVSDGQVLAEVGDVLWYIAQLMRHIPFNESVDSGVDFSDLDALVASTWAIEFEFEATLLGAAGGAVILAGRIAGRVKKSMRDGTLDGERVLVALCDLLRCLDAIARFYGSTLALVAAGNRDKLTSRQERGVLKGDGDHR